MAKPTPKQLHRAVDALYAIGIELDVVQRQIVNAACPNDPPFPEVV